MPAGEAPLHFVNRLSKTKKPSCRGTIRSPASTVPCFEIRLGFQSFDEERWVVNLVVPRVARETLVPPCYSVANIAAHIRHGIQTATGILSAVVIHHAVLAVIATVPGFVVAAFRTNQLSFYVHKELRARNDLLP